MAAPGTRFAALEAARSVTVYSQALSSTAIMFAEYDDETQELTLEFERGTYQYQMVPEDVYLGLIAASSPGGYYHAVIKGVY